MAQSGAARRLPGTPPVRLLLVASVPGAREPIAHLALYDDPIEARAAFRALRLRTTPRTEWAQLVSIDSSARMRPLCWFGTTSPRLGAGPEDTDAGAGAGGEVTGVKPAGRRRRTWPRLATPPSRRAQALAARTAG